MGGASSYPAYDMNRTTCLLRGRGLSRVSFSFKDGHPLEVMDLADNQITQLPPNLKRLRVLDLTNNNIIELNAQMIQALESYEGLIELKLSNNNLTYLPSKIGKLQMLTKLHLNGNKFSEPPKEIQFLQYLDISCNKLTYLTITDRMMTLYANFNRLTTLSCLNRNLTTLNICGNDIISIDDAKFESLQNLDISFNKLENIDKLLTNCPKLEILDVSYNKITNIPPLPQRIVTLLANNNIITTVDPSFSNLPLLRTIFIFNNKITSFPALPKSTVVVRLDSNKVKTIAPIVSETIEGIQMMSNELDDIPDISKSKIQLLYCCDNKISLISPNNLCQSLVSINVAQNNISVLPKEIFQLPLLQTLTIHDNFLKEIPAEIATSKLIQINISVNPISKLPALPPTLQWVLAFNCKFTEIDQNIKNLPYLKVLDLSFNDISVLPKLEGVSNIFFAHNKISEMPPLWKDLLLVDLSYNNLSTATIPAECSSLQEFDVSHNNLKDFKYQGIHERLRILKLSHNADLSFKFEYSIFPKLNSIDVTATQIKIPYPPDNMRELLTSDMRFFKSADLVSVNFLSPDVGYSDLKGYRETMEDSLLIRTNLPCNADAFAVLDGHGGSRTAMLTTHYLHIYLQELKSITENSIRKMLEDIVYTVRKSNYDDGCTLCMCIISSGTIFAVNIGDSRMILVKEDSSFEKLSHDHKPTSRDELERIRKAGYWVYNGRTSGVLALSRSIGDFSIGGVSSSPDIIVRKISPGDKKIVICCDGVFDVLDNDEVAKLANIYQNPFEAACLLRNAAFARQTQDNVTSIVIDLAKYAK